MLTFPSLPRERGEAVRCDLRVKSSSTASVCRLIEWDTPLPTQCLESRSLPDTCTVPKRQILTGSQSRNMLTQLLVVCLAVSCACALVNSLTEADKTLILKEHNDVREEQPAKHMPSLIWSIKLAYLAQQWTDKCDYGHQDGKPWGENIGLMDDARNNAGTIAHVIGQWAAQSHYNTVGNFKCCGPNTSSCCDFTQMIWADTTMVGCGVSNCPNLGSGAAYFACYYYPKGNSFKKACGPKGNRCIRKVKPYVRE
ncbi:hypothetical protein RRG08_032346 [Elysia crispata]|uniref:SCP domain-containing protein n=1 Tax=Elysia crispata TaxID=231223 RepID=A0AAE1A2M2_9GAST|nr:hypothetical protein RRG08_032346 [Elysia crispata]